MSGYAPLTWGSLGEWSRFTGNVPDEEDVSALFILDSVMLNPNPKAE